MIKKWACRASSGYHFLWPYVNKKKEAWRQFHLVLQSVLMKEVFGYVPEFPILLRCRGFISSIPGFLLRFFYFDQVTV